MFSNLLFFIAFSRTLLIHFSVPKIGSMESDEEPIVIRRSRARVGPTTNAVSVASSSIARPNVARRRQRRESGEFWAVLCSHDEYHDFSPLGLSSVQAASGRPVCSMEGFARCRWAVDRHQGTYTENERTMHNYKSFSQSGQLLMFAQMIPASVCHFNSRASLFVCLVSKNPNPFLASVDSFTCFWNVQLDF